MLKKHGPVIAFRLIALISGLAVDQDNFCPSYPSATRAFDQESFSLDLAYAVYSNAIQAADGPKALGVVPPVKNIIDAGIFKKMSQDGVDAAPLTTDNEFVRRVYLDLTGRIPTWEQAESFLAEPSSRKREELVDRLLDSPAYVDQMSRWFLDRFQVRANQQRSISAPAALGFYDFVRD